MSYVMGEPIDHSIECSDHHELLAGMKLSRNCGRLCDSTGCISMATNGKLKDIANHLSSHFMPETGSDSKQFIAFQNDGNLVRYSGTGESTWSSGTNDQGCTRVEKRGNVLLIECKNSIKKLTLEREPFT